jgi:hypothetical protein
MALEGIRQFIWLALMVLGSLRYVNVGAGAAEVAVRQRDRMQLGLRGLWDVAQQLIRP